MKNSKLHILFAMGIVFSSTSMVVQAYGKDCAQKESSQNGKYCMKSIEHDLSKIMREFRKNHDVEAANNQLDKMPARIKKSVAKMKQNEEHCSMWETHQHTLQRKLKDARKEVKRYSEKN